MKFTIKDFFCKCDQIRRNLRIWSCLLKKSLMENFIFVQWVVLMKEINYQVRSRTSNHCVSQQRAKIESWVIYHKSNSKNHNNIRIEEILSLCFWDSGLLKNTIFWLGDGTNSNIISYVSLRIKIRT